MTQVAATLADNNVLFPPGRIVQGDLYDPQDKDMQGNPLTIKNGTNAGKERVNYYFALAIPKTQAAWWSEPWGQRINALGYAAWPQGQTQNPRFAWKIEDGDSQTPNQNGRKNADREGHPGCWIVKFGSSFPTKVFDSQGNPMLEKGLVKPGFWVEVLGSIASNENAQNPGIYINHVMVSYRAPDKEIVSGPDPRKVGFGQAPLPPGVTAAPASHITPHIPAGAAPPPAVPGAAVPAAHPVPGASPPPAVPGAAAPPPAAAPAAPVGVQPHAGFIAPPAGGAYPSVPPAAGVPAPSSPPAPGVPSAPATPAPPAYADPLGAPAGHRMVNPQGPRYSDYTSKGWTDAQLLANGHMVKL